MEFPERKLSADVSWNEDDVPEKTYIPEVHERHAFKHDLHRGLQPRQIAMVIATKELC